MKTLLILILILTTSFLSAILWNTRNFPDAGYKCDFPAHWEVLKPDAGDFIAGIPPEPGKKPNTYLHVRRIELQPQQSKEGLDSLATKLMEFYQAEIKVNKGSHFFQSSSIRDSIDELPSRFIVNSFQMDGNTHINRHTFTLKENTLLWFCLACPSQDFEEMLSTFFIMEAEYNIY